LIKKPTLFFLKQKWQANSPNEYFYLNQENNGLNWIVKKFKGSSIYAHIVLKGDKSRGPITDLVINSGL
jgi:predicted ribonuclease YlaK